MSPQIPAKSHATAWTMALLAVPVLYLASVGPYVAMLRNGTLGYDPRSDWLLTLYSPVGWMMGREPFDKPLENYVEWWCRVLPGRDRS